MKKYDFKIGVSLIVLSWIMFLGLGVPFAIRHYDEAGLLLTIILIPLCIFLEIKGYYAMAFYMLVHSIRYGIKFGDWRIPVFVLVAIIIIYLTKMLGEFFIHDSKRNDIKKS